MARAVRVAAVVGSLRVASYNGWLLRAAAELAPSELTLVPVGLAEIPLFNQDVEELGDPPRVAAFRAALYDADAVIVASPEYNYGVPGVLKNAIDWISRPSGRSPLQRKPMAIMGASTGPSGTMRMQLQLRQTLQAVGAYVMPRPEIVVTGCRDKFDAEGHLADEKTREHLAAFLSAFVDWARRA